MLQQVTRSPFGQVMRQTACDVCQGEGKVASEPCEQCDGRGREVRRRTLRVDVPEGIADGQRIRLSGRGHAGERGGPPGDLYVLVRIAADERFLRDGDDLVTVARRLGARTRRSAPRFTAPTLDGDVEVRVAPGTQPGEVIIVRGQGMPRAAAAAAGAGDLRVVVNVVVPRSSEPRAAQAGREARRLDDRRERARPTSRSSASSSALLGG